MLGALDGITVIHFGCYIAGPLLAELLAQNGANVIRVDSPGGPRLGGLPDAYLSRRKRRITLNLRNERDRHIALELTQSADVVVENFRPGVMDRLRLGPEGLLAAAPGLIYCSLPGFAATEPRASTPAWEGVVMSATAGYRRLREHWDWKARSNSVVNEPGRPLFTGLPIASTTAAMLGALQGVTAMLRRDQIGRGAWVEIPLSEAMLEVVGFHLEFPDFIGPRQDLPRPFLGSYKCADGRFVDQVSYPRFVERFLIGGSVCDEWRAAGLSDLAQVFTDPDLRLRADQRFAQLIRSRPPSDWEAIATTLGIPFAQVRTPAEWLANDHAHQSGTVVDLDDPEYGRISMAGAAMCFGEMPTVLAPRSLPGGDSRQVFDHARPPAPRVSTPASSEDNAPLAGVSVVELSQVVAGPVAGRLLADYGADVTKVANPSPTGNNGFHGSYTDRGKRTVFLDVQDPADLGCLRSAIDEADVLLENYAFGAIERYGLGFESLREARRDLVYVSLSVFSRQGPWRARRGHENQAVVATGFSARHGGPDAWPIYQPYLVCDIGTGIMGALATALGLYHRGRSGRGQHISTSLSHIATMHQAIYLFDAPDENRLPEPAGLTAVGSYRRCSACTRPWTAGCSWLPRRTRRMHCDERSGFRRTSGNLSSSPTPTAR